MTPIAQRAWRPMGGFGRASLAARLSVAFLGLVAFVLIVNGGLDTYLTYNQAKRAALEVEAEKARAAAERVGVFLDEIQTQLGWTAGVEWGYAKPEQQRYDFVRLLRQAPAITALAYLDGKGREQLAVSRLEPDAVASGKDFSADPRFVRAVADKVWFGPVEFRRGSEPYMTVALAHVGKTPGVTVADVNLKLVWDVVSAIHVGDKGFAYVVDDHGRLIAHPDLSLVLRNTDFSRLPQVAAVLAGQGTGEAEVARSLDGVSVLTAHAVAPKTHWAVFVEQPTSEALATAYRSLLRSLALLGLGLALAAVSGVALARRMAAPIRLLQAGAEKLGSGDLGQRLDIRTGDEIEALAGGFNRMAERLQDSYETLESKVEARTRDLNEALAQQTATAELLKVVSESPTDAKPVFDAIVLTAVRLFGCQMSVVYQVSGERLTPVTAARSGRMMRADELAPPMPIDPAANFPSRALASGNTVYVPDLSGPDTPAYARIMHSRYGVASAVYLPLLRGDERLGVFWLTAAEIDAFSAQDISLAESFRDQALIALGNTRLFEQVQARTRDLEESLDQQTATAEILKVIASATNDTAPVFEAIVSSAKRLLGGRLSLLTRFVDDVAHLAAFTPVSPDYDAAIAGAFPRRADDPVAVALRAGRTALIKDTETEDHWGWREGGRQTGFRSAANVPLVSRGATIGGLTVNSAEPNAFDADDVELLRTFADQAVIAIENVRLFNETKEALAQQTATADVLKVISRSAFGLKAVLQTLVDSAVRLCASDGVIYLKDGDVYRAEAAFGAETPGADPRNRSPRRPGRESITGRVALSGRVEQIPDNEADPEFQVAPAQRMNMRALLGVPLLLDGEVEGVFVLAKPEVGFFSERAVELVRSFADQAVIAIQNVRLFEAVQAKTRDLEHALEGQTATSEILRVIAGAPGEADKALQFIAETCARLFSAASVALHIADGDEFVREYRIGASAKRIEAAYPPSSIKVGGRNLPGAVVAEVRQIHIPDLDDLDPAMADFPGLPHARAAGARTVCGTPLRHENRALGALIVFRNVLQPLAADELALLQTFADQAVIAIENARLFDAVQAKTRDLEHALERQMATSEVLRIIAGTPGEADKALQFIAETCGRLFSAPSVALQIVEGGEFVREYRVGASAQRIGAAYPRSNIKVGGRNLPGTVVAQVRQIHIPDLDDLDPAMADFPGLPHARAAGARTVCGTPLRQENHAVGSLIVFRNVLQPFTANELGLLQTFADQAVIAIENARLFDAVQARTRDLEEALQQQTATADVLKAISRSAFDLQTVLDTLLASAAGLVGASGGAIAIREDDKLRFKSSVSPVRDAPLGLIGKTIPINRATVAGRAAATADLVYIPDGSADPEFQRLTHNSQGSCFLGLPLSRDGRVEGVLTLVSTTVNAFTPRHIEVARTFADQAVIAIENARLFEEVQARTREVEQSLQDLRKTQDRLVQSEKLASLGQLTAGIAHEIKNPLNFVNNFSALSRELLEELRETLQRLPDDARADADELMAMVDSNLEKVVSHGKRADSIVKNMLLHSRDGSGERSPVNVNAMVEEALNLGYHGARAEKPGFNVAIERSLDPGAGEAHLYLQEVTRVLLNLISNGFYATDKRREADGPGYAPTLKASTRDLGHSVEIRIRDNGSGIPDEVRAKMFNPFFTTKPAGEGTGLGLSLSHDIVVKQHGGTLEVETEPGAFTEFVITLPREGAGA